MRTFYLISFSVFLTFCSLCNLAAKPYPENPYQDYFDAAYLQYPAIPRGFLEAFAWHNTRMQVLDPSLTSCTEMPKAYGVLGLFKDGKNYFRPNAQLIANYLNISVDNLFVNPQSEILAFASFFNLQLSLFNGPLSNQNKLRIMASLSEIPNDQSAINTFAQEAMIWEWIRFLNDPYAGINYGFEKYGFKAEDFFSSQNIAIHNSDFIQLNQNSVSNAAGDTLQIPKSSDYTPALWVAAPTCNYGSRNGTAVSAVTIHTVQGSYAGCISWFGNCNASVSAHYVLRSSDGQVTQMVLESNRGFHVGSENPYTIGLEHEGYVNNAAWYTQAMYQSSANLVSDICNSGYGINRLRTAWFPWAATTNYNAAGIPGACVRIKGHQHYANQTHTDPGANWNWDYYFKLLNPVVNPTVYNTASGTLTDAGGIAANYGNDERKVWVISPTNALSVTLNFISFNLENTWDYLYVYNGSNVNAPLLGVYTGTNLPPTLIANSGSMTLEFRSDCASTNPGWEAQWTSQIPGPVIPPDIIAPLTQIQMVSPWITQDTSVFIADSDTGSGLKNSYYALYYDAANSWKGLNTHGFLYDDFEQATLQPDWNAYLGLWSATGQHLIQTDELENNTNIGIALNQNNHSRFLYHFSAAYMGSNANKRVGFHFMCDSVQKTNRGNSYFIWYRDASQEFEIYKVQNDVFSLVYDTSLTLNPSQFYDFKVAFNKQNGEIEVWVNNSKIAQYTDASPLQIGNAISFRTGHSMMQVGHLETYVGRNSNSSIALNLGLGNPLPNQNSSPSHPAGIIKSISTDQAGNLGSAQNLLNIDSTAPSLPSNLRDMDSVDVDISAQASSVYKAFWDASIDNESGVLEYYLLAGSAPNYTDVSNVVSVGSVLNYSIPSVLISNMEYKFGVFAVNNAGLKSDTVWSDGYKWIVDLSQEEWDGKEFKIYPNPSMGDLKIEGNYSEMELQIFDIKGREIYRKTLQANEILQVGNSLSSGTYLIRCKSKEHEEVHKWVLKK